ncbi:MAG: tetratricopeptide repeat protein [Candidatus Korobacteraceae bacterium]
MKFLMLKALIVLMGLTVVGYCVSIDDPQQNTAAMQSMTVAQLEKAGDNARTQKNYEQAIQYFKEALRQDRKSAKLYNKLGLAELSTGDYAAARSDFAKATKYDRKYPEAWNDLGVVYYVQKNYGAAAKCFQKAIALDETHASFHVNLGITWFAQNNMDNAMREYTRALELDPEALMRSSNAAMSAQIASREERAKQDYMLAKVFAKLGYVDSCLVCLKKAKEDGYSDLTNVYKDEEFSRVRQDARLAEIVPPPASK